MTTRKAQSKKRLVLIDGNAILHRAYHALPKLTSKGGSPTNAVYGFCSMLLRIINDLRPQYLAVTFDRPEPTFRHQEFVGYQAQRPKTEADLTSQIDKVKELLVAMGIKIFENPGFEADDLIGTIAAMAAFPSSLPSLPSPLDTIIVSGDKDLMQLVNKSTKLYLPIRGLSQGELVDEKGVKEKLGIKPEQVIDYKGLVGDPSDNYPGVPGVGPKTAIDLLSKFQTLDNIYQALGKNTLEATKQRLRLLRSGKNGKKKRQKHLGGMRMHSCKVEEISTTIVDKLQAGHDSALLSKKLATIITDVPIKVDWNKLKLPQISNQKTLNVLKKLGFKSLVRRLQGPKENKPKRKKGKQLGLF